MRRYLGIFLLLVVTVALWQWHAASQRDAGGPARDGADSSLVTGTHPDDATVPTRAVRKPSEESSAETASLSDALNKLKEAYGCHACPDSPFVAKSTGEAAWMQSRGFPTRDQLRNLDGIDREQLRKQADAGDLVAMGLYGKILLGEHREADAVGYLTKAELRGSVYALYGLSDWKSGASDSADRYASASYVRLAWLLGDSKASDYLYEHFPGFGNAEWKIVDRDAALYFRRLRGMQATMLGTPPSIQPRPVGE